MPAVTMSETSLVENSWIALIQSSKIKLFLCRKKYTYTVTSGH